MYRPSIGHFVDDPGFIYEDFARRGEDSSIPTFRIQVRFYMFNISKIKFTLISLTSIGCNKIH